MKFWKTVGSVAVIVLIGACGEMPGDDGDEAEKEAAAPIPVEIAVPTRADISATYTGTAAIEAFAEATVIAKVGGEILKLYAEEGDEVSAGQTLAKLDGDRLRLSLRQSEANLQKLRRDFQRNRDLKEKSLISQGDFEKIQYEMEALEASYNLAKLELSYTEIKAPITGVVSARLVKIGNTIAVNAPVFEITSLDPLVIYLHIPEREYRRIARGMPAEITVDALAGQRFPATISRISPIIDATTGTFKITVEVTDDERRLKPGMFARVAIESDVRRDALQIARAAIIDDEEPAVYVVEKDTAKRRSITTGLAANGMIEIISGLAGNERVVVVGQTGLRDGALVDVINVDSPPVPEAAADKADQAATNLQPDQS
ncbi:MAG: efflux RND transporter periplasmic adaptor subunit [Woeseia sp.]|nr:efflux RND transporter periplasmic adaptor subunit [Woeseia sp.]MBT8096023.1 efflux RND transporter periplasmic adaptor subunit [Woeseia sp.]NNE59526.1 efflux RND transporter periplasmic adaptor subunit [Woeseia sp.]NNL54371.1 efflux RND transporter periplasmic adaptor subunit [Woeseia sp.]